MFDTSMGKQEWRRAIALETEGAHRIYLLPVLTAPMVFRIIHSTTRGRGGRVSSADLGITGSR